MKGSFSIDSLLAKKTERDSSNNKNAKGPSGGNDAIRTLSSGSSRNSQRSTPSPEPRLSPDVPIMEKHKLYKNGFIPRPGLLNTHHQALLQPSPLALQGILQAQYLNAINGQTSGHSHGQTPYIPNNSAFHTQAEHAFKFAHVHAAHAQSGTMSPYLNEWMSRGGMLMSRMMDYTGKYSFTAYNRLSSSYWLILSGKRRFFA